MHDDRPPGRFRDYVALARPSHWTKHVFVLPGIVLALSLRAGAAGVEDVPWWSILVGLAAACLAASANYVLNEWLDAGDDLHHPRKSSRPAVASSLSPAVVWVEYVVVLVAAVATSLVVSRPFALGIGLFLASGWLYNVRPWRTKDRFLVDVLTESINNPLRLTLGWLMVSPQSLPPASLLLAYWMGGGFLMTVKRLAEYRAVVAVAGLEKLRLYRRSFQHYTESRLLLSAFLYSQLAAFFLAVFLIKYRIEYLLSLPFFALLFVAYLRLGLRPDSTAQAPERLFRERSVMLPLVALVVALFVLTFVDLAWLEVLSDPHYLRAPWGQGG